MTRTTATLLVTAMLLATFAWQAQSQPSQGFGPVFDPSNVALRVNIVAGGGSGGTSSNFGTAFPTSGTAVGGKDSSGAFASFTVSNTGRLQVTCDNCSSSAATFGTAFPSNGGPGGYKDASGAFASFTGQNGKQNVIVGNESTLAATVTSSSVLGTAAPSTAYQLGFRDALGALASISAANGLPVNVVAGGGSGGTASNFGTAFPGAGTAAGFKDSSGAMASATVANGKQNVIVGNESTLIGTVSVSSSVLPTGAALDTSVQSVNSSVQGVETAIRESLANWNTAMPISGQAIAFNNNGVTASASTTQGFPTTAGGLSSGGARNAFIMCDQSASISTANAGNFRLVSSASGANIYVCGYTFVAGATPVGVKFLSGRDDGSSGSACTGTVAGNADLTGVMNVAASGGVVNTPSLVPAFKTLAGYGLCINLSNGAQVSGHIAYTRF